MLEVTFIGHQGWLVRTPGTAVLVDPLLSPSFGHGGHLGLVYPPRTLDLSALGPIDAVWLSHEHDDHFDLPSLHQLDRRIAIYLSAHASDNAAGVLGAMGFTVHRVAADTTRTLGELSLRTFAADHRSRPRNDEWDVLPFWLADRNGHGSLVSSVDVMMPPSMRAALEQQPPPPGIWGYANNSTLTAFQTPQSPLPPELIDDDCARLARIVGRRLARVCEQWRPAAVWLTGGGWSFPRERRWIDHHAFRLDHASVCAELAKLSPPLDPRPAPAEVGQQVTLRDGRVEHRRLCPAIAPAPRETWPSRTYDPTVPIPPLTDVPPATGQRKLSVPIETLAQQLGDYARFLYDTPLFSALHSLPPRIDGFASTWGFWLRDGNRTHALRHDPRGARFIPEPIDDPQAQWLSGMELWASDLHAFCEGELAPSGLCYAGRIRVWNHSVAQLRVSPHDLWMYGHPLRRPTATRRLYERLLVALPKRDPVVRARGGPPPVAPGPK